MLRAFRWCLLLTVLAWESVSAAVNCTNLPARPAPVIVRSGIPGGPVGFVYDANYGEVRTQLEVWRISGTVSTLYARGWVDNRDALETLYDDSTTYFLGANQRWRAFPAGVYTVRQRGWTGCGYGPWSAGARFSVLCPPTLTPPARPAPRAQPLRPARRPSPAPGQQQQLPYLAHP